MRAIQTTVYQFDELSDEAKEKAREWYRSTDDGDSLDYIVSDFATIAPVFGLELSTHSVKLMNGKTRQDPDVYYSVGFSQSDYAGFNGTWRYVAGCQKAVREEFPKDTTLHRIVDDWAALQKRFFYRLTAVADYHHYYGQRVTSVERSDDKYISNEYETEKEAAEIVGDLANWLYSQFREEVEYQNSDEQVDESIRANEYEFTEDGERA